MQTNETFTKMKKQKPLWNQAKPQKAKPDYSKARKDKQERREGVNTWA
jgi:hypothetical protein